MKEVQELVEMSKYAGERFDLIQAGGGNTSVKLPDGTMLIKASGFLLSDLDSQNGFSTVLTQKVIDVVDNPQILQSQNKREREAMANSLVNEATIDKSKRPSIETLLHSLLPKYVLHTHPVLVNVITARKDWNAILQNLFPDAVNVAYTTPGIELAIELQKGLNQYRNQHPVYPKLIFLQNHGLIVSSDTYSEIETLTEEVLQKIESFLKIAPFKHKLTTGISKLFKRAIPDHQLISFLSDDVLIQQANVELFTQRPFTPDILVFCGFEPVHIRSLDDAQPITDYLQRFGMPPKIVLYNGNVFCMAANVKKARETEEVLKFHLLTLSMNTLSEVNFLEEDELFYLANWEAEKYRQKL